MRSGPNYSIVVSDAEAWVISPSLNASHLTWAPDFADWVYLNGNPLILSIPGNPYTGYNLQSLNINTGKLNLLCNYTFPQGQSFFLPPIVLGKDQELLALLDDGTGKLITQFATWRTDTCSLTRTDIVGNGVVSDFLVDIAYSMVEDKVFSVDQQGNVYEFDPELLTMRNVSRGEFAQPLGNLAMDQVAEEVYFLMDTSPVSLGVFEVKTGKGRKVPITGALYSVVNLALKVE